MKLPLLCIGAITVLAAGTAVRESLRFTLAASQSQASAPSEWGDRASGLRLGLRHESGAAGRSGTGLEISLQNAGEADFTINLGIVVGNGRFMTPSAVRLLLTDASGATRDLEFADRRYAGVAGRLDDYVVPLGAGATHVLQTTLDDFWDPAARERPLKLQGRYRVAAALDGQGARASNLDMKGVALMNFWKGSVRSNAIDVFVSSTGR